MEYYLWNSSHIKNERFFLDSTQEVLKKLGLHDIYYKWSLELDAMETKCDQLKTDG